MTKPTTLSPVQLHQINEAIKTAPESPLNALDLCDRCSKGAKAQFTLPHAENPLRFCGHHTRAYLGALMAAQPVSFWVAAEDLWTVNGVDVPAPDNRRAGDGLTDS